MLTNTEREALDLTAQLANTLSLVVGSGRTRTGDLNELLMHVHAIQHAVMAQAACREYPYDFRLLGDTLQ